MQWLCRISAGWRTGESCSGGTLIAVFPHAAVGEHVVGLRAFALNAGAVHGSDAAQLVVGVTPAAQARLKGIKRKAH